MCLGASYKAPEAPKLPPPAPEPEKAEDTLGVKAGIQNRRRRAARLGLSQLRIPTSSSTGVNVPQ